LRALHRRIGVLFQGAALFSSMTLEDNVAAPVREHTTLPDSVVRTLARMKLASVGLHAFSGYHPAETSGGMRKRAGIARALALDPEVLFLDEPSAGLDPVTAGGLDDLILYLRERIGLTQIVVSHELPSIFRIADRILMLREGRIVAEGSREDILYSQDPRVLDFLLRNAPDLEAAREALEAIGEPAS
jgi:phospholipid/cholesterol/gamma-HCH transport system ATP-binding protein